MGIYADDSQEFGIKVNVANSTDSALVPDNTSLSASGRA